MTFFPQKKDLKTGIRLLCVFPPLIHSFLTLYIVSSPNTPLEQKCRKKNQGLTFKTHWFALGAGKSGHIYCFKTRGV